MTEILSCETCAYHRTRVHAWTERGVHPPRHHTANVVQCRRKPPTVVMDNHEQKTLWPYVEPDDFCGEWSATFK